MRRTDADAPEQALPISILDPASRRSRIPPKRHLSADPLFKITENARPPGARYPRRMFVIWSAPSPLTIAALLAAAQTWRATLPLRPDARFGGLNGCGAADALAAHSCSRRILCRRKPLTGGANSREIRANTHATFKHLKLRGPKSATNDKKPISSPTLRPQPGGTRQKPKS